MKLEWEEIPHDNPNFSMYRTPIYGGWLVQVKTIGIETPSITFVPDPELFWSINNNTRPMTIDEKTFLYLRNQNKQP